MVTVCHHSASLVMPNGDPPDRLFYTLTLMIDSYIVRVLIQMSTKEINDGGRASGRESVDTCCEYEGRRSRNSTSSGRRSTPLLASTPHRRTPSLKTGAKLMVTIYSYMIYDICHVCLQARKTVQNNYKHARRMYCIVFWWISPNIWIH